MALLNLLNDLGKSAFLRQEIHLNCSRFDLFGHRPWLIAAWSASIFRARRSLGLDPIAGALATGSRWSGTWTSLLARIPSLPVGRATAARPGITPFAPVLTDLAFVIGVAILL